MIYSNLHTHSLFCDGRDTVEELCQAAYNLGLSALGISAHAPLPFATNWHLKTEHLKRYVDTVRAAGERWRGRLELYLGLEIDFVKDVCGPADGRFLALGLDYIIGAVHYLVPPQSEPFTIDGPFKEVLTGIELGYKGQVMAMVEDYWQAVTDMVNSGPPPIIGHLDLIKRWNTTGRWFDEADKLYWQSLSPALDAISASGSIVELNTGGMSRCGLSEPYPGLALLAELQRRNVEVTINSDAHNRYQLNALFEEAEGWLKAAGFTSRLVFQNGGFKSLRI